jgi:hypothetical protein
MLFVPGSNFQEVFQCRWSGSNELVSDTWSLVEGWVSWGKKKEKMGGILKNELPGKQQRKKILWVMCPLIALKG